MTAHESPAEGQLQLRRLVPPRKASSMMLPRGPGGWGVLKVSPFPHAPIFLASSQARELGTATGVRDASHHFLSP